MPVIVGARFWHSVSCYQFSRRMKQLLFFGGCPGAPEELLSGGCWAKLAATVVLELGKQWCTQHVHMYVHVHVASQPGLPIVLNIEQHKKTWVWGCHVHCTCTYTCTCIYNHINNFCYVHTCACMSIVCIYRIVFVIVRPCLLGLYPSAVGLIQILPCAFGIKPVVSMV